MSSRNDRIGDEPPNLLVRYPMSFRLSKLARVVHTGEDRVIPRGVFSALILAVIILLLARGIEIRISDIIIHFRR
jgi:hypothetical protein